MNRIETELPAPARPFPANKYREPMTVAEIMLMLLSFDPNQKLVFSDPDAGDFDLVGDVGSTLSTDNFVADVRPILRLRRRS